MKCRRDRGGLAAAYLQRQHERARTGTGYWIRSSARSGGYPADAMSVLARWAWSLDKMHRLELNVEPWNESHRNCRTTVATAATSRSV